MCSGLLRYMYPRLCIHLSLYLREYTDSDMHKCMYTHAYLCVYSRVFDGYFLGPMTNLYAQFLQNFTRLFQNKRWMFITELKKIGPLIVVIWYYYVDILWSFKQWCDCYLITFNIYVSSKVKFISAKIIKLLESSLQMYIQVRINLIYMEIVLPFSVIIARNNIWCKWTNKREFKTSQLRAK